MSFTGGPHDDARPIPDAVLVEMAAAVALARRHHATIDLELSRDPKGNLRLRTVAIRGASSQALVALDKGPTMEGS